jgi:WD40 repeat protein
VNVSRRHALAGITTSLIALACSNRDPQPIEPRPHRYWVPALKIVTGAIKTHRALEINTRELASQTQTTTQYASAITAQFDSIESLSQTLIPLRPPPVARVAHQYLTGTIDALVDIVRTVRRYRESREPELIVHVITLAQRSRASLMSFVDNLHTIAPGIASEGFRQMLFDLGEFHIDPRRVPMFAVFIGEFTDVVQARAKIGSRLPEIKLSRQYEHWVEGRRFSSVTAATDSAQAWIADGFEARVEEVVDLDLQLTEVRPPAVGSWTERLWARQTDFEIAGLAVADHGELAVAIGRRGDIASYNLQGQPQWTSNLGIPLAHVSIDPSGSLIAAFAFDLLLLNPDGSNVWQRPVALDSNQKLEQVVFSNDGATLIARSTNASGMGRVFKVDRTGRLWGPTKDYIAASSVGVDLATGIVGVGSSRNGVNEVITISPDGTFNQAFGVESRPHKVLFNQNGTQTIVVTTDGILTFDSSDGSLLHRLDFPTTHASHIPDSNTIVLAGHTGLGAFRPDGTEVWGKIPVAAQDLAVTKDYIIAQTDERTFQVFQSDGSRLGKLPMSSPIRAFALSRPNNLLVTANTDRTIEAWKLPERASNP